MFDLYLKRNYKKITKDVKKQDVKVVLSKYLYEDKEYIVIVDNLFNFCTQHYSLKGWEREFICGLKKKVDNRIELSKTQKERAMELTKKHAIY